MDFEPSELPWNEEQWLRFMQQADARAARFGELLETVGDDPDGDEIVAREMGWTGLLERMQEAKAGDSGEIEESDGDEAVPGWPAEAEADADEDLAGDLTEDEDDFDLETIPAYAQARAWGLAVHDAFADTLNSQPAEQFEDEPDDPLLVAYGESLVVAAKLAGGHGIGYEDDSICGNIVCCRLSLEAGQRSVAALEQLHAQKILPADVVVPLITRGREVCDLVAARIAELRSRVWWQ